ncbi:uncharacterized protein LOC122881667 isoform X2 [Siniperca chuatsi]|nr:uncharacterized protein LOC122881667 isoform X2 [Siniperca chuatsi]
MVSLDLTRYCRALSVRYIHGKQYWHFHKRSSLLANAADRQSQSVLILVVTLTRSCWGSTAARESFQWLTVSGSFTPDSCASSTSAPMLIGNERPQKTIQKIILDCTNLEGIFLEKSGRRTTKPICRLIMGFSSWLVFLDQMLNLQNPCGMQKLEENVQQATVSLENFHSISRIIRLDNQDTRPARQQRDKLAAIR